MGSVAAIFAAIYIDQGTARRERKAKQSEARELREGRWKAVANCAAVLEEVGTSFDDCVFSSGEVHQLSEAHRFQIDGLIETMRRLSKRGTLDDPDLAAALTQAFVVLANTFDELCRMSVDSDVARDAFRSAALSRAKVIRGLLKAK